MGFIFVGRGLFVATLFPMAISLGWKSLQNCYELSENPKKNVFFTVILIDIVGGGKITLSPRLWAQLTLNSSNIQLAPKIRVNTGCLIWSDFPPKMPYPSLLKDRYLNSYTTSVYNIRKTLNKIPSTQ